MKPALSFLSIAAIAAEKHCEPIDVMLDIALDDGLRSGLRTVAGTPAVDRDYQTSAPGLYVVGPGVAPTFGPVMRFVYGADHAARTVGRRLAGTAARRADVTVDAAR